MEGGRKAFSFFQVTMQQAARTGKLVSECRTRVATTLAVKYGLHMRSIDFFLKLREVKSKFALALGKELL